MSLRKILHLAMFVLACVSGSSFAGTITFSTAESPLREKMHPPGAFFGNYHNQGWYNNTGSNSGQDYTSTGNFPTSEYRSYFIFDLSSLDSKVVGATLRLHRLYGIYRSGVEFGFWDVSTPAAEVAPQHVMDVAPPIRPDIFADLGSGEMYGHHFLGPVDVYNQDDYAMEILSFKLNQDAVKAINAAGGFFAIGVSILNDPSQAASIFGGQGGIANYLDVITVPVDEPSPVFLLGLGLIGLLVTKRLRMPEASGRHAR